MNDKLRKIQLMGFDVDGIMTDGTVSFLEGHGWTRRWYIQDGHGLLALRDIGIKLAVITASSKDDAVIRHRFTHLKFDYIVTGSTDKLAAMDEIRKELSLSWDEIGYMGDDIPDIALLQKAGFSATVPNSTPTVRAHVHYLTKLSGGAGAVREVCDQIIAAKSV